MMRAVNWTRMRSLARMLAVFACVGAVSASAYAAVRKQGNWPSQDRSVSLDARGVSRAEAIQKLADAAGWSVVLHAPPGDPVDLRVKNQPAATILEMLLEDADYVANRQGDLISISRAATDAKPTPVPVAAVEPPARAESSTAAVPPPVPAPDPDVPSAEEPSADASADASGPPAKDRAAQGDDRVVTGGSLKIEAGETVHDVVTLGGSVEVLGTVTGDVLVTGGSVKVRKGARVEGDITAMGGSVDVEEGATINGEVAVVGGAVHRGDKSESGVKLSLSGDRKSRADRVGASARGVAHRVGAAITRAALLFIFGTVLLALAGGRMESLQTEIAARPMRSFALGIVGALTGALILLALVVTLIGIPVAVVGSVLGVLAVYGGICAALVTAGGALIGHKTKNPYLHLALGCLLFLISGALPVVGGIVTAVVVMVGIGCLVATRGAGLFVSRRNGNGNGSGPYRTAAV